MKLGRFCFLLVPLVLVMFTGLVFNLIAQVAGAVDDGCAWLYDEINRGK